MDATTLQGIRNHAKKKSDEARRACFNQIATAAEAAEALLNALRDYERQAELADDHFKSRSLVHAVSVRLRNPLADPDGLAACEALCEAASVYQTIADFLDD